ncbi:MAG: hypothetical protein ACYCYP_05185 [Leptospirales bacterium]
MDPISRERDRMFFMLEEASAPSLFSSSDSPDHVTIWSLVCWVSIWTVETSVASLVFRSGLF